MNPFDGLDMGENCKPAFADVENDGDHDLVLGDISGALKYFENTGTAAAPHFVARVGGANPFASVDVHARSAPALIDYDKDGTLSSVHQKNAIATARFVARRRPGSRRGWC